MRVDPQEERTVDAVLPAIEADRLGNREDVLLVERALERRSAVARCPERNALRGYRGIGLERVVLRHESRNVREYRFWRRLPRQRANCHSRFSPELSLSSRWKPTLSHPEECVNRTLSMRKRMVLRTDRQC